MSGLYSGGGTSATSTTTSGLPEWALPYAQDTLAKQSALSDVGYQPYGDNRIQGFDPLQTQAQNQAANMGTSGITGQAAGIAGGIAGQAAGTSYAPTQFTPNQVGTQSFTGQGTADQYMNPYMQNVVDIQKREAQRQSGIQGTQQAGQAAQAGALGGSRDAIMRAERERNLGTQMSDIQAQGSNAAFQQAQQQFNTEQQAGMQAQLANQQQGMNAQQMGEQSRQYGAGLGMQGLQTGLQAAGQLGNLGQQQFQQGMDVNKLQAAYGAQKQAMGQQGLSQAYQDFLAQKQYPQTQLSNMASMMRGLPIQQQTTTGTPGTPSNLQTLGSLGSMAYGLSQFFADGGAVSSFDDGGSVDSQGNIENIVHKLSDSQLAQAEQLAKARGDQEELQAISMEKAARASEKRGIGAAPVNMAQMLPTMESHARGGIVAFGAGGDTEDEDAGETEAQNYMSANSEGLPPIPAQEGPGQPGIYQDALAQMQAQAKNIAESKYTPMKPEEYNKAIEDRMAMYQKGMPDIQSEQKANIAKLEEQGAQNLKHGKGLAAIQAGAAMLEGPSAWHGLAKGASTFGESYGSAVKADQAQKQALQSMKFNIADSQRKEQMGLMRDSMAAADQARKDHAAAQQFGIDKAKALGTVYRGIAQTSRPGAAAKAPTPPKLAEQLGAAEVKAAMNPTDKAAQTELAALRRAVAAAKSSFSVSDIGGVKAGIEGDKTKVAAAATTSRTNAGINALVEKGKLLDPTYQQALAAGDTAGMEAAKDAMYKSIEARQKPSAAPGVVPVANKAAADFDAKWAKLKPNQTLVGPDGVTYTKK